MENAVLRLLALRPRSTQEIKTYLLRWFRRQRLEVDATLIDQTIAKLTRQGLLDDSEFARWLINSRSKKHGPARIIRELKHFGIPPDIYQPLLPASEQVLESARALLHSQSRYRNLGDISVKKRAYDYLLRHGFPPSLIRSLFDSDGQKE